MDRERVDRTQTGPQLAVVFGAGPVGTAASERLLERGLRVRMVNRSGRVPAQLEGRVKSVQADVLDGDAATRAAAGASIVLHCVNVSYEKWFSLLPTIQENLIDAAVHNRAVLAAAENLYMYSVPETGPIAEDTPVDPPSRKGRLRAELHEMLHTAHKQRGLEWVTVRASDYYGPGATAQSHFGSRFLDPLFSGKQPALFGSPDQPHSVVYVEDYGRAIADAALDPTSHNQAWIAPHDRPLTRRDFAQMFYRAAGRTGDVGSISNLLVSIAGLFVPFLREMPEMRYQFDAPFTVDDSAFRRHFDATPVPLEEGVTRTVAWYRTARSS